MVESDPSRHATAFFGIESIIDAGSESQFGVKPLWKNSMMLVVQSQTTDELRGAHYGWSIDQRVIDEDLYDLEREPYNKVFSGHRFDPEFIVGATRKVLPGGKSIIEINPTMPQSGVVMNAIREGLLDAVSTGVWIKKVRCSCGAEGSFVPECDHMQGDDYDGQPVKWTISKAQYFHQAFVSIGGDPGANILIHNSAFGDSQKRLLSNSSASTNSINENNKQLQKEDLELTEDQQEKLIEQGKLKEQVEQLNQKLKQMQADVENKDRQIDELSKSNVEQKKMLDQFEEREKQRLKEHRENLIESTLDAQVSAGIITESQKPSARETMLSFRDDRFDVEIDKILKRCKELAATSAGNKPDPLGQSTSQEQPMPSESGDASFDIDKITAEQLGSFGFLVDKRKKAFDAIKGRK